MPVRRAGGAGGLDAPPGLTACRGAQEPSGPGRGRPGSPYCRGPPLRATERPPPGRVGVVHLPRSGGGARPGPGLGAPPCPVPLSYSSCCRRAPAGVPLAASALSAEVGQPGLTAPALVPLGRSGPALPGADGKRAAGERSRTLPVCPRWSESLVSEWLLSCPQIVDGEAPLEVSCAS